MDLEFNIKKETQNTMVYQENTEDHPPVIGTLYIQKWYAKKLGNTVTITIKDK
jgi:hypothetical protein